MKFPFPITLRRLASIAALSLLFAGATGRSCLADGGNPLQSLAGYWTFDEGQGTTVYDYSGHGHEGIIHGGAEWVDGKFGKALHFNGTDSSVEIPEGDWNTSAPISFTFWYKRDRDSGGQILEHELGGAVKGAYAFDGTRFGMYDGALGDTSVQITGEGTLWVFVAITISPTEIRAYQNGELQSTKPIKGFPQVTGSLHFGARGSVGDEFFKGSLDDVALFHDVLRPEDIRAMYQAYQNGQTLAPFAGPQVVGVSLPKIFYASGESAKAHIVVKNFSDQPQQGVVSTQVVSAIDNERPLPAVPISLPAQGVAAVDVPVTFTGEEYGCQIRANVEYDLSSKTPQRGRSVTNDFAVADNFWKVAIGAPIPTASVSAETPEHLAARLNQVRGNYCNWVEVYFWAPDDWGCMAPAADRDWWYSGQEGYFVQRASLKSLIQQAHAFGMRAITYGKSTSGGPDGWEIARQHPDWFSTNGTARPSGVSYPSDLDNWNNRDLRLSGKFKPSSTWDFLNPDFRLQAPLDYGIGQIALSAQQFGWDGVRFDGHFTVPNDELSTYNMRLLKERLWKQDPNFLFGFNYGFGPELYGGINHEMREGMAGGGMWMQEAIKAWAYTNTKHYATWDDYATNELKVAKQIQAIGGTYQCIWTLTANVRSEYKLIYGLIAGGHPVYSTHDIVPGCANWGKFMTRWSEFLWGQNLKAMEAPADHIAVVSPQPVLWQPLAQEMVESPTRKFWVVHVVNPPSTEDIAKTSDDQLPPPQQNVVVTVKPPAGERIMRAVLVQPEQEPFDTALTLGASTAGQTFTIPQLTSWAMVVVELEGKYTVPPTVPRFSAPPDLIQVAAAQKAATTPGAPEPIDPLHPSTGIKPGPNEQIWETDSGFWNIAADAVADPDASGGLAQKTQFGALGRSWMGPLSPGRYKLSLRMKWTGPDADKLSAQVNVMSSDSKNVLLSGKVMLNDATSTGHQPGAYQYQVLDLDMKQGDMFHCYLGVNRLPNLDPADAVYLDLIKVTKVESYSDDQVATWGKSIPRPADLPELHGSAPRTVLHVKGMDSSFYGIDKAIKCDSTYEVPGTYEALYAYDAVIMDNVDFAGDYATRRLYRDYVADGGRLIILGGTDAYPTTWENTYLDTMMPVEVKGNALLPFRPPLVFSDAGGKPYAGNPSLFWHHDVTLRPGMEVLASAGGQPILARRKLGKGQCITFTGTACGEGTAANPAFWESPAWTKLVERMVDN